MSWLYSPTRNGTLTNIPDYVRDTPYKTMNIFNVDVDWRETILQSNVPGSATLGGSLHNVLGQLGQDGYLRGAFILHLFTFVFGALTCASSYHPKYNKGVTKTFGLRPALVLFTISRFFAWIYMAVTNSQRVTRGFTLFWLVPLFFENASNALLVYNMARTVCQPLVVANGYSRARGVALGLSISYAVLAFAQVITVGALQGIRCTYSFVVFDNPLGGITPPSASWLDVVLGFLGFSWGWVFFGLSIHSLRKTRGKLGPELRVVGKFMIAVSVLWSLRSFMTGITTVGIWDYFRSTQRPYRITSFITAILTDTLGLSLFSLLFYCYRPQQLPLYDGSAGHTKLADEKTEVDS